jgi:putative transposase
VKRTKIKNISQLSHELSSIDVQAMLMSRAKDAILSAAVDLLEQDMEQLCGRPFQRKSNFELCHRGGSETTSFMLDGALHSAKRPRARNADGEVELPSLAKLRDRDLLDKQMQSKLVRGVSTRNYEEVVANFANKTGISKSSVSRAFKRASQKDLDAINSSDLSKYAFVAILIDGTNVGGRMVVIAVGITSESQKIPLGLKEGETENAEVVKDLLSGLMARGFTLKTDRLLAMLDGGKALRSAVKSLWGDRVLIQRCWLHKARNLEGYLPKENHKQMWRRMKKMMGLVSKADAENEFNSLRKWLGEISHDAEKSLLEAGDELLTVHDLGITGEFRNALSTTNAVESLIGVSKTKLRNVKNWGYHPKTGQKVPRDKALRWIATAIQTHRPKMRALRGGKEQMKTLINSLSLLDSNQKAA